MSDEPEYIDLITGKPLEPWAADAMKRRATPAELPALPSREEIAGIFSVPSDVAARQLMGLYYELSGNHDMAADVRSDDWEKGTGFGPGSERQLLGVMAALVEAVRKEAAALHPPASVAEVEGDENDTPEARLEMVRVVLAAIAAGGEPVPLAKAGLDFCDLTQAERERMRGESATPMPSGEKG